MEPGEARQPDLVAAWLKDQIRAGRMVPGQRLVEAELVARTGATRAILRRAFQRLEGEGVLELVPHRGAMIRRLEVGAVEAAYAVREVLEGLAARLAAAAPDRAGLGELADLASMAARTGERRAYIAANSRWHDEMIRLAGNPELTAQLDRARLASVHFLARVLFDTTVIAEADASQRHVTEAIITGDGALAEERMRSHVRGGLAALVRVLREDHGL